MGPSTRCSGGVLGARRRWCGRVRIPEYRAGFHVQWDRRPLVAAVESRRPSDRAQDSGTPALNLAARRVWLAGRSLIEIFQPIRRGGVSELARAAIPKSGLCRVSRVPANTGMGEKARIESCPEPQRRRPATRIGSPLVKQSSRRDVASAEKTIAAGYKRRDVR